MKVVWIEQPGGVSSGDIGWTWGHPELNVFMFQIRLLIVHAAVRRRNYSSAVGGGEKTGIE